MIGQEVDQDLWIYGTIFFYRMIDLIQLSITAKQRNIIIKIIIIIYIVNMNI